MFFEERKEDKIRKAKEEAQKKIEENRLLGGEEVGASSSVTSLLEDASRDIARVSLVTYSDDPSSSSSASSS
jgi:hypothetical protein